MRGDTALLCECEYQVGDEAAGSAMLVSVKLKDYRHARL